jgi:hypothetical protein
MARHHLNRRTFLRGLGGATVALPFLEIMSEAKGATASPLRYLVCFGGVSIAGERSTPNELVPNTIGANYDLKTATAPFGTTNIASEISIISGLKIPSAGSGAVPAGGRINSFHSTMVSPLLSGVRSTSGDTEALGPSSDQVVAAAFGAVTTFPSIAYCIQASTYTQPNGHLGHLMSYKKVNGQLIPIAPVVSPQAAFKALFGTYVPPSSTSAETKKKDLDRRARLSVLDLVRDDSQLLLKRLGGADARRVQQHYDEVRDLEKQVAALPPIAQGSCVVPADPGADPAIGGNIQDPNYEINYKIDTGYSGEEQRAKIFCDLIRMAFACDLTRVGSLMFTHFSSMMNMYQVTGLASDLHELTHGQEGIGGDGTHHVAQALAWHLKHFGYLADSMRSCADGDGTLLDHSALVFLFEGGHGTDPSSGTNPSPHSTENMVALVAGRAGGLKAGLHIPFPGGHPVQVMVTAMNAVGVPTQALGEVSGKVPGLL